MGTRSISLLPILALIGCSGGGESSPGNAGGTGDHDASTEAQAEASPDGPPDAPKDAVPDVPVEPDRNEVIEKAGGDVCAEYAYARCMVVNACLAPRSMWRCTPDLAMACRARAAEPGSGMDDAALRACAQALAVDWCGQPFECEFASKGPREEGASCYFNAQCETGFCLRPPPGERCAADANGTITCARSCGTCTQRFGLGERCDDDFRGCEADFVCADNGDDTYQCVEPKPEGAPCQSNNECIRPLECSVLHKVCQPRTPNPCFDEMDCHPALYCSPNGCAPPTSVGLGEVCNAPHGFPLVQCDEGYCSGSTTKTCTPAIPVGGACSSSTPPCEPVARCYEDVCRPMDYSTCL